MDINEILLRVVRGHWRLLTACVLLPPLVVGVLAVIATTTYSSSARLQGGTLLPSSDTEADALLNVVKGVGTSPAVVQRALDEADITGRSTQAMVTEIDVTRLGSSAVFDLSVTDADPRTAVAFAQALATDVVSYLNRAGDARTENLLSGLGDRQKQLFDQRQRTESALALARDPVTTADLSAQISGIDQQLSDVRSTISQLQLGGISAGSAGSAALVSPAGDAVSTPSAVRSQLGLALVVGLILGLLATSLVEVLRPRVADARAFGREIGVPFIGSLPPPDPGGDGDQDEDVDRETALALRRAADRAGVRRVLLVGPVGPERLATVADALRRALRADEPRIDGHAPPIRPSPRPRPVVQENGSAESAEPAGADTSTIVLEAPWAPTDAPVGDPLDVLPFTGLEPTARTDDHCGLLPVVPPLALQTELRRVDELARATGWPTVGVIGDSRPTRRPRPALFRRTS